MNLRFKQWIDGNIGRALAAINVVLVRGIGLLLRRDHSLKEAPENILVIKMLGLGSILMAMDSLHALRLKYPNAKLILMTGKGVAPGIEPLQFFDEIWIHNDKSIFKLIGSGFGLLFKSWKLKKLWVVDLEVYSVLTTLFSAWTMAQNRFGFQLNKVHFRNYLNTHNSYFNQFVTVTENYQSLIQQMNVKEAIPYEIQLEIPTEPRNKEFIAINNTCSDLGGHLRKMEASLLKQVIDIILNHSHLQVALTGAPSDWKDNETFIQSFGFENNSRVKNIAGQLSFKAYYEFLQFECKAMISIDSAPLHMAMRLGLPTFSLWGPIQPQQRFNFKDQNKHSFHFLHKTCSPCIHLSDIVPCGGNNHCMKDMHIQSIQNQILSLL
ncbi:MAG: glycosyltransferase family 9 protein [Bacteroidia bacterium]